jgi:carbonic anhydrase
MSSTPGGAPARPTPAEAWTALREGNERFARDELTHPSQSAARRDELRTAQHPFAVVLGCSDSRVPPEVVFDQGLGDLFVVRTAGHVLDPTVIGSVEYGTEAAGAALVVVLGHVACGAVAATAQTLSTGEQPAGFVRAVVDGVLPSVADLPAGASGPVDADALRAAHVRHTVAALRGYSPALEAAAAAGRVAIVGAEYDLATGEVRLLDVVGDVGEPVPAA